MYEYYAGEYSDVCTTEWMAAVREDNEYEPHELDRVLDPFIVGVWLWLALLES
jgi:hypothetical protein